ncbi:MAG: TadE/TadG family type IV pilus assembly protein [Mycobacteriales bacterium]
MSEAGGPQGERGARWADRCALAPSGLSGQRTRRRDDGTAVVEFVLLGVVLMVPLLCLALALSTVQRTVLGVTQAAREAGRAYVTGTASTAAARADQAARLALSDRGVPAAGARIRYGSGGSGCAEAAATSWPLRPGEVFAVCVTAPLRLPAVPGFLVGDRTTVTARQVVQADRYRDYTA